MLSGDPNLPNGGLFARFPGLYIPILDMSFNGPEPTDTQFDTVVITRQYDGVADFPLYPLNVIADLNAVLGVFYVHLYPFDVSLAPDPSTSPPIQDTHGDTSYYFFETQDLPLFGPLRTLGVPEPLIDVVEPFFRVLVELGYDRSIPPWEPTPARLIPPLNPATVAADLVDAIGEGINNALALIGSPAPLSIPAARPDRPRRRLAAGERPLSRVARRESTATHQSTFVAGQPSATPTADVDAGAQAGAASVADVCAGRRPAPTPTELRSSPTAVRKTRPASTTTNNSLTTTDLHYRRRSRPQRRRTGRWSGRATGPPGATAPPAMRSATIEHAVDDGHDDVNHRRQPSTTTPQVPVRRPTVLKQRGPGDR